MACCEMMKDQLGWVCKKHPNRWDCPDVVILAPALSSAIGIPIRDGGVSFYKIKFCPWCGARTNT